MGDLPGKVGVTLGDLPVHLLREDLLQLEAVDGEGTASAHHNPVAVLPAKEVALEPHFRLLLFHPVLLVADDGTFRRKGKN